jgi:hypothetical protein
VNQFEERNIGNIRTMYGSLWKVCQRPTSSLFHVGFFMRMIREPSLRTTFLASVNVKAAAAPNPVSTMNPM